MKLRSLFLLGVGFVVCVLGASLAAGSRLAAPHPVVIGAPPGDLPAQAVVFPSGSGSLLSGWFVQGKGGQGGILLMHSVRSNRREMLGRARFLHRAGYAILLFDFQAHGESRGKQMTFGYLEAQDAQAAFANLQQRIPGEPIGVIGVSLGGAAALLGSLAQTAHALVLEAVYPTFEEAAANRIVIRFGRVGRYLAPLLIWQVDFLLGVDPQWLSPIERIAQSKAPILLIAGSEDQHTPLSETRRLFRQAPPPKALWIVSGAAHQNFYRYAPKEYQRRILRFFQKHMQDS
jgi:fermentation-respiration switch protein FrsA (DUF1100 family)